jgi:undecaprenyl-diphosphatase
VRVPGPEAAERAGLRLLLGLLGCLAVGLVAVPFAVLVRRAWPPLVEADTALSAAAERAVGESITLLVAGRVATLAGEPVLLSALALGLAALLWRRGARRLAAYVIAARVGAVVLSQGLKAAVDRVRPVFDEPVAVALGQSFPSGHALGAAAFWSTVAVLLLPVLGRRGRVLLALGTAVLLLAVAASRVLLGVHYPSDVAGGLLLGLGWAAVCTAVFAAWRAEEGRPGTVLSDGLDPEGPP